MNLDNTLQQLNPLSHSDFWDAFNEYAKQTNHTLLEQFGKLYNITYEGRYELKIGPDNRQIALIRYLKNNNVKIEFYTEDKQLFDHLYNKKNQIEQELDQALQWDRMDNNKATKVYFEKIFYNTDTLRYVFDYLIDMSVKFRKVFDKYCNPFKNYVVEIAKVNKQDRYNAIINVLEQNNIKYEIQKIQGYDTLGNIIVKGKSDSQNKIIVSAHYDNVSETPGANDNASACAILLNLIINNKENKKNIEYVFFDLEERYGVGSRYYLNNTNNITYSYALNLDMCGLGENIVVAKYHLNNEDSEKINNIFQTHNVEVVNNLPFGDAYSFRNRNIKTFYIINSTNKDLDWFRNYHVNNYGFNETDFSLTMHKPNDTVDTININQVEKIYMFTFDLLQSL